VGGQSLIDRFDIFFGAATFAAQANAYERGFRQRDVRFFIELFTDWVNPTFEWEGLPIQNTHISRYIESLVEEGYARKITRKSRPGYRLTRTGLIEMISRIVDKPYFHSPDHFFFAYSFIENYTPRLFALVKHEGTKFPYGLQLEIESLIGK